MIWVLYGACVFAGVCTLVAIALEHHGKILK